MSFNPEQTAFLFPGQGSQAMGMGQLLAQSDPAAAEVFQEADATLGYSLSDICWNGPIEKLNDTHFTQPALLTHSVAVLNAFKNLYPDFIPAHTAGHSLGEFSALVAAGALSFPDALQLVQERGRTMKEAGSIHPGGMAAVLGLEVDRVAELCQEASSESGGGIWVANDNCPGQVVISGDETTLKLASERLIGLGARKVVRLKVSIAAHTPIMGVALDGFNRALQDTPILEPEIPTIGNVEAKPLITASEVRDDLSAQLTSMVRWTESIHTMIDAGVSTFIEMGSKSVLTGLTRRIDRSKQGLALDAPDTFVAFAKAIK